MLQTIPESPPRPDRAIEVRGVHKSFRIPSHRVDSLKERILGAGRGQSHKELKALVDISFDVDRGEFLGIIGRNGSGKSTLLKLLASIYRIDQGHDQGRRTARPVHRARRRVQPRAHRQ